MSTADLSNAKQPDLSHVTRIDIGCGLPHQVYEGCFGIDVNPDYQPGLLHNADDGLPFADGQLEFINSDNSLEHFRNPHFVLRECYRVLAKGGRMRLVVPNAQWAPLVLVNLFVDLDWLWHRWMSSRFKQERSVHWTLYTRFLITKVCEDVGFRVQSRNGLLYSKEIELHLIKS